MKIFISYSREDAGDFARHVHRYLMNLGHDVFIDVNSITVGDPWASSIENNISNCDVFLVILTPDSLGSTHVENEVLQAQRENKIIVPCKSEDITYNDIKWGLDKIQGLEFTNEYQLTRKLYSKIRNFEYKIPIDTNEKTMPKNDIQKDTKIQDNIYTNSVQWYLNKAKVFERLKQYQRALSNYNEAIKINPNNFEAHFNKALLLYKIGKLEKAYESIEKAIDLQPENADIWYHKGLILEKLERYDEALEAFNTDLQIDHTDIKSLSAKADILFKLERYKEALVAFDEIIRLDPDNKDTKRNKEGVIKKLKNQEYSSLQKEIEYKFQNKDYSNVIELCDKAIDIDKDNYKPYLYKANSLLKLSRYQEAIEYYDKVLAVDVNNKDAIENKHTALQVLRIEKVKNSYENKDYSRVIELCNEIKESDTDPILQKYKGDAFYMLGNYNPALQCYDKVLEIEPKNVYAFNKRRLVREQLYKQEPKAIKLVFEKAWSIEIEPQYIAIDPNGYVYVSSCGTKSVTYRKFLREKVEDENYSYVYKFDSDGNFITKWGSHGNGNGQFDHPNGVSVDTKGYVYVADWGNDRIQKFDSNGNLITKWGRRGDGNGQFNEPNGIAVDSKGYVYVVDGRNHRIQKFDSNGSFIAKWGRHGNDNGKFHDPEGIVFNLSTDYVYVADSYNHRIQKFDSNGSFIAKWGREGGRDGEFKYPNGISVDSLGFVYVTEPRNNRIQKFDSNGNFITKWGSTGQGAGQFHYPQGIAVDFEGYVYVADSNNHRIQIFASTTNDLLKNKKP